jgi:hypothetical protein
MQNVLRYSTLSVAVHLLPQAVAGIAVNIVAGAILHRVDNRLLVMIGSVSYFGAMLLLATMKFGGGDEGDRYWGRVFPALVLSVVGADLQFNVANVRTDLYIKILCLRVISNMFIDVCSLIAPVIPTITCWRNLQHHHQDRHSYRFRNF